MRNVTFLDGIANCDIPLPWHQLTTLKNIRGHIRGIPDLLRQCQVSQQYSMVDETEHPMPFSNILHCLLTWSWPRRISQQH